MPQDLHGHTRVHVECREQRVAGAAGVVYTDASHACLGAPQIKTAADCPRLDGASGARGEHQAISGPGAAVLC